MNNKNSRIVDYAILLLGAEVISDKTTAFQLEAEAPVSPGFIPLKVNADEAVSSITEKETKQVKGFTEYRERLDEKRVLVVSLNDGSLCKVVKPADASRYFPNGRRELRREYLRGWADGLTARDIF
jgi:hypothetical protein